MPLAHLSRARIHYEVWGEGPPLLCIMGLGAPLEGFEPQVRGLGKGRKVILYDNRGVGRSSIRALPYSVEGLALDALELLHHLRLNEPVDVLGISLGGMIAQQLALAAPSRLNSLMLAATFATSDGSIAKKVVSMTARSLVRYLRSGLGPRAHFEQAIRHEWEKKVVSSGPLAPEVKQMLDSAWALRVPGFPQDLGVLGQVWALLSYRADPAELARIRVPTLVMAGSADELAPLHHSELLARSIPGARLEVLAGAPHGMNLVSAPLFNATVAAFLERHSPLHRLAG
jgi:pimeloyl-ACP methyl ester carboxylesterase